VVVTLPVSLAAILLINAENKPEDATLDSSLKNVDGKTISLSDYSDQKGLIFVFTCNPCPNAKAKASNYPFSNLNDETQKVYQAYGATLTPHIFLLEKKA
jgi:hypothetical protein